MLPPNKKRPCLHQETKAFHILCGTTLFAPEIKTRDHSGACNGASRPGLLTFQPGCSEVILPLSSPAVLHQNNGSLCGLEMGTRPHHSMYACFIVSVFRRNVKGVEEKTPVRCPRTGVFKKFYSSAW